MEPGGVDLSMTFCRERAAGRLQALERRSKTIATSGSERFGREAWLMHVIDLPIRHLSDGLGCRGANRNKL